MNTSDFPSCEVQSSPLSNFTLFANYKPENKLNVVVCTWKQGLIQLLSERIQKFMNWQLWFFYISTLVFNLIIFIIFLFFFERKLLLSISKPIQQLTAEIKDPSKMKEAKRILNKRDTELQQSVRGSSVRRLSRAQSQDSEFNASIFRDTEALDEEDELTDEPINEVEALKNVFY